MADLSAFWSQLWASGATPNCLSCGETNWATHVTAVPEFNPVTEQLDFDPAEYSAVALVCSSCGFIRLHKLNLDLDDDENGGNGAAG
jgi:hypothetical protein